MIGKAPTTTSLYDDEIVLTVPLHGLASRQEDRRPFLPYFCDQTIKVNAAIADGSAYEVNTEITGEGSCRQVIRRRS